MLLKYYELPHDLQYNIDVNTVLYTGTSVHK